MDLKRVCCLCNALTDKRVKHAVATTGAQRPGEGGPRPAAAAFSAANALQTLLRLVRDHAPQTEAAIQPADSGISRSTSGCLPTKISNLAGRQCRCCGIRKSSNT